MSARASLPVRWAAKRALALADPLVIRRHRARHPDELPVPPRALRARTGVPGVGDWSERGAETAGELASGLAEAGGSPGESRAVLDFGCGSGRVLPHMAAHAPEARLHGCDVDADAIAWAARHLPGIEWRTSPFRPPLPCPDAAFDLVYSVSVFSHLDEPLQDAWLAEVRRVLAPGGWALLTVHGPHAFAEFRAGRVRSAWCPGAAERLPAGLADDAMEFVPYRRSIWNRAELPGVAGPFGLAFHGADYLRQRWGRRLEIAAILPRAVTGWQDLVVARAGR
jgi:SAM-dependent methyltransferase